MNRSWVRFPQAAQIRPPGTGWAFLRARVVLVLLVARCPTGVPGAGEPGRPRDRHTRACGSEWSISKPARALRSLRRPPHRRCLRCWCVAWCVVSKPSQAPPPPAALRPGPVDQAARLSETHVAFARACLRGFETAIAFAGEKRVFLVRFSAAVVMPVSAVPCWG